MEVHVFKSLEELNEAAANWVSLVIERILQTQARCCVLLSGGNTPKPLYQLLATPPYSLRIDWKKIHVFFGDERVVPFDDDRNNGKMAFDAFLSKVPIPVEQIHYIDTSKDPAVAAEDYARLLHQYFDNSKQSFDLALLGMGDDGHTLSLFPGTDAVSEKHKFVVTFLLASQQMHRISLTPGIVNRSASIAFLVSGASKSGVLKKILQQDSPSNFFPAQLIRPASGDLHWFVDQAAGGFITQKPI
jgi:6-phosphogluconolactonase